MIYKKILHVKNRFQWGIGREIIYKGPKEYGREVFGLGSQRNQ